MVFLQLESSSDTMRNYDNPTAVALQQCRKKVTKPFTLFLRLVSEKIKEKLPYTFHNLFIILGWVARALFRR